MFWFTWRDERGKRSSVSCRNLDDRAVHLIRYYSSPPFRLKLYRAVRKSRRLWSNSLTPSTQERGLDKLRTKHKWAALMLATPSSFGPGFLRISQIRVFLHSAYKFYVRVCRELIVSGREPESKQSQQPIWVGIPRNIDWATFVAK